MGPSARESIVDGARRWRASARRELHWRDWGADSVVFEASSGLTYQFAPLAAAVMAVFEQHDLCLDDLTATIAADLGVVADNELRSALVTIVEQFHGLRWIEPVDDE